MKNPISWLLNKAVDWVPPRQAERLIYKLEHKVGIGSGSEPDQSGETVVLKILKQAAAEPLRIFDVGANQGQFASEVVSYLGDSCEYEIHSFEPSPQTFAMFLKKHKDNSSIVANNLGLGATRQKTSLYLDAQGSGLASLTQRKLHHLGIDHGAITQEIELTTLDEYCSTAGIERIDLLKIDVEGHELDVLAGGSKLLQSGGIRLVQFEFGGCNIDTRTFFKDFFCLFADRGYELFRILPDCRLLPLTQYRELDEKFRTANYLAVNTSMVRPREFERSVA